MSRGFSFKQFTIEQDRCAMKVGTDGVLLGAWAKVRGRVLDIGTGTGVVALMAAQKGADCVDAVEIDSDASAQASENFARSPWADRLRVINMPLSEFSESTSSKYDTIVTNPPYFINSLKCEDSGRLTARHNDLLPHSQLAECAAKLLKEDGSLFTIFPYQEGNLFIVTAAESGLYLNSRLDIRPTPEAAIKRVILEFSLCRKSDITTSELTIAVDKNRTYSDKYRELTKDFYLKF